MENINLLQVPVGKTYHILFIEGGNRMASRLRQYGLFPGDSLRVVQLAPFKGPLLLEANGREIAIGRAIAEKIIVEAD